MIAIPKFVNVSGSNRGLNLAVRSLAVLIVANHETGRLPLTLIVADNFR
jgi:hypothetical protein